VPDRTVNQGDSRSLKDNETSHLTCIYAAQRIRTRCLPSWGSNPRTDLTDLTEKHRAFRLAGYRHVIGTLWPISDYHAIQIADDLYAVLEAQGTTGTAAALHMVTRQLRDRWPRTPSVWASHIHVGP
jgi:CHAT domain